MLLNGPTKKDAQYFGVFCGKFRAKRILHVSVNAQILFIWNLFLHIDQLCQIWRESTQNCKRYRTDTWDHRQAGRQSRRVYRIQYLFIGHRPQLNGKFVIIWLWRTTSMALCKNVVTPVLMHWSYHGPALSHIQLNVVITRSNTTWYNIQYSS